VLFQVEGWSAETQEPLVINYTKREAVPLKKKSMAILVCTREPWIYFVWMQVRMYVCMYVCMLIY